MQNNNNPISDLIWTIQASKEQFSLVLAHCNYTEFRKHIIAQVHEKCPVKIREIELSSKTTDIHDTIASAIGNIMPNAVMVFGFELCDDSEQILKNANNVREKFRRHFPFPLILWVNDDITRKLIHVAPDFENWASSFIWFELSDEELRQALHKNADNFFEKILENKESVFLFADLSIPQEFDYFLKEIKKRQPDLDLKLKAELNLLEGKYVEDRRQWNSAIAYYTESLSFWKEERNQEKQGILQYFIAKCYEKKGDFPNTKSYFQDCIEAFDKRKALSAKYSCELCHVLEKSGEWKELEEAAQKALDLNQACNNIFECSVCYRLLAEAAFQKQEWKKSAQLAQEALNTTSSEDKNKARLILAKAYKKSGKPENAIEALTPILEEIKQPGLSNPKLYSELLKLLHQLYFDQKQYREAFETKQERYSLEQRFRLRAFIGAGRLQAQQEENRTETDVALEIQASGRWTDVERLISMLNEDRYKLIVFHGESGVGKSSVLEAGLYPALKKEFINNRRVVPVLIRDYADWIQNLLSACYKALTGNIKSSDEFLLYDEAEPHDKRYKAKPCNEEGDSETFEVLKQLIENEKESFFIVLIFDQFEEFFFTNPQRKKRREFYTFLKESLNMENVKVILSLREDYLHYLLESERIVELEVINRDILTRNIRYPLGNFTQEDAEKIIKNLTEHTLSEFRLNDKLIERIIKDLAGDSKEVRPIELQIVGFQMEAKNIKSLEKYKKPKDELVQEFLEEVIHDCGKENENIAQLILYLLTDERLTRPLKTRSEIKNELKNSGLENIKDEQLDLVLKILEGSGLIFLVPGEPADRYQLVHDYLVEFIRKGRAKDVKTQLEEEKKKRIRAEKRLFRFAFVAGIFIIVISIAFSLIFSWKERVAKINERIAKINEIEALSQSSYALFLSNRKDLESLIVGVKAGKKSKQIGLPEELNRQVIYKFREVIYGVHEKNRMQGHTEQVWCVRFSPDGKTLASGSYDDTIRLWNVADGTQIYTLEGYTYDFWSVDFSPDGKIMASGSKDTIVRLWNVENGSLIDTLKGHKNSVRSVDFSPDGKTLASGSYDDTVILWNIEDGTIKNTLKGYKDNVWSVDFSPDGKTLASGSSDKTVILWNVENGTIKNTLKGHEDYVLSVKFSPDGKTLASGSSDKTVILWNVENGMIKNTLKGHKEHVWSVDFSPDSKTLASGSNDNTVRLWKVADGTQVALFEGHTNQVYSVDFSPDGKILASGGSGENIIRLWNVVSDGMEIATLKEHNNDVWSVDFSPDGKNLASGSWDNTLKLWNVEESTIIYSLNHMEPVLSVDFSPDGKILASGGSGENIENILWNVVSDGMEIAVLKEHNNDVCSVDFSPDGKNLASGSWDNTLKLWNVEESTIIYSLNHMEPVLSVNVCPNGKILASGGYNTIKLWNMANGAQVRTLGRHGVRIQSLDFSPDGKTLASGGWDTTIRLWNVADGTLIRMLKGHSGVVQSVNFSPDEKMLASGSEDKTVKLWNVTEGREIATLKGHTGGVQSVNFSPDGKILASGSKDETVKLWNVAEGMEVTTLKGHTAGVQSVNFSPDGKILASGSEDKTVKLWNVAKATEANEVAILKGHTARVQSVNFSPDGKMLASGSWDNTVRLWNIRHSTESLDNLLLRACKWLRPYLKHNPEVSKDDRSLCDDILSSSEP